MQDIRNLSDRELLVLVATESRHTRQLFEEHKEDQSEKNKIFFEVRDEVRDIKTTSKAIAAIGAFISTCVSIGAAVFGRT